MAPMTAPEGGEGAGIFKQAPPGQAELEALANQVEALCYQIREPESRPLRHVKARLVELCRDAGLIVSTREWTPTRGTRDGYRGRLALAVASRDPATHNGKPRCYLAVEICKSVLTHKAVAKLQHIHQVKAPHMPVLTMAVLTQASEYSLTDGIDRIVTLGAESATS